VKKINLLLILLCLALTACSTAYYGTMEKVGIEKRDILVSRVQDSVDAQNDAKQVFVSALDRFNEVVDYDGGDLEKMYKSLSKDLEKSQVKADEVNHRIEKVEEVAEDLFKEWKKELKDYDSADLRRSSAEQLKKTEARTDDLIATMKKTAATMDPVLTRFNDQVLYLKHNLNAQALAGIRGEAKKMESDVSALITSMEKSIAEAEAFIRDMQ
jgi:hypothetical protein